MALCYEVAQECFGLYLRPVWQGGGRMRACLNLWGALGSGSEGGLHDVGASCRLHRQFCISRAGR